MLLKVNKFVALLLLITLIMSCSNEGIYSNRDANYEIRVPHGWHVMPNKDYRSVSFSKYGKNIYGNSVISVRVDSMRLESPLQQLEGDVLPSFQRVSDQGNVPMRVVEEPHRVDFNGRRWATAKCSDGNDKVWRAYVTFSDRYSFVLVLFALGKNTDKDEKIFLSTVKSLKTYD